MTSISATSNPSYQSPLQKLHAELQSEVNSGAISSSDQTALSSALNDIDASLKSDQASTSTGTQQSPPGDLKSKIDNLIAGEVSSGKLTSAQATELKNVFQTAFAHGHHGGPPPSDGSDSSSADGSSTSSTTDGSSSSDSSTSIADALQQFLQSLQSSLSGSSSTSYGATGNASTATSSGTSFSALLIDYKT